MQHTKPRKTPKQSLTLTMHATTLQRLEKEAKKQLRSRANLAVALITDGLKNRLQYILQNPIAEESEATNNATAIDAEATPETATNTSGNQP